MANPNAWLHAQLRQPSAVPGPRHLTHPPARTHAGDQAHRIRQAKRETKILLKALHAATNPSIRLTAEFEAAMRLRTLASWQNGPDVEDRPSSLDLVLTPDGKSWQDWRDNLRPGLLTEGELGRAKGSFDDWWMMMTNFHMEFLFRRSWKWQLKEFVDTSKGLGEEKLLRWTKEAHRRMIYSRIEIQTMMSLTRATYAAREIREAVAYMEANGLPGDNDDDDAGIVWSERDRLELLRSGKTDTNTNVPKLDDAAGDKLWGVKLGDKLCCEEGVKEGVQPADEKADAEKPEDTEPVADEEAHNT